MSDAQTGLMRDDTTAKNHVIRVYSSNSPNHDSQRELVHIQHKLTLLNLG